MIAELYDQLALAPGPSTSAMIRAQRKGWRKPLDWDNGYCTAVRTQTPPRPDAAGAPTPAQPEPHTATPANYQPPRASSTPTDQGR